MRLEWVLVAVAAADSTNAFKMSPQDKSYGDVAVPGSADKFSAPQKAPSAEPETPSVVSDNEDPEILDDYHPDRLGVSAKSGNEKEDDVKEATKEDTTRVPSPEDPKAGLKSSKGGSSGGVGAKGDEHAQTEAQAASEDRRVLSHDAVDPAKDKFELGHLIAAVSMIVFSELGDKTFFIAALFAMRHSHWFVFSASFGALAIMTILSAVLGRILPAILSPRLTTGLAALLFYVFGAKMLMEGYALDASSNTTDEMMEVEHEIEAQDKSADSLEKGLGGQGAQQTAVSGVSNLLSLLISPLWIQIFVMTFLGEWGDRSQIATIAMGAGGHYWEVVSGSIVGHGLCTLLAIVSGKLVATKLSLRTITLGGAACFFLFGLLYTYDCLYD